MCFKRNIYWITFNHFFTSDLFKKVNHKLKKKKGGPCWLYDFIYGELVLAEEIKDWSSCYVMQAWSINVENPKEGSELKFGMRYC